MHIDLGFIMLYAMCEDNHQVNRSLRTFLEKRHKQFKQTFLKLAAFETKYVHGIINYLGFHVIVSSIVDV